MNWSVALELVFVTAIAVTAYGAYHRATQAHIMANGAQLQLAFLRDRLGISDAETEEWHRQVHPDCFHDHDDAPPAGDTPEPGGEVDGPVLPGETCVLCGDDDTLRSTYEPAQRRMRVLHDDGNECTEAPVQPDGQRIGRWPWPRRTGR